MTAASAAPPAPPVPAALPAGWPLHLLALGAFAVAQPLFEVLGGGATFFVARDAPPLDLWLFALGVALAPGALAALLVRLARLAGVRLARAALLTATGAFALLLVLAPLSRAAGGEALWPPWIALLLGAGFALAYARLAWLQSLLTILAPAPVVFAGLFLLGGGVRRLALPGALERVAGVGRRDAPSALFLVLDELPLQSLQRPDGSIDAGRFPNFARLAARSTWFPNATASHESTEYALPMILTGLRPSSAELLPTAADHPRSVFTLLAESHRMRTWETFTSLCPPELDDRGAATAHSQRAPALRRWWALARDGGVVFGHIVLPGPWARRALPPIDNTWGAFGAGEGSVADAAPDAGAPSDAQAERSEALDRDAKDTAARTQRPALVREFTASLDGEPGPTLWFLHVLLPHGPFVHLPSVATYDPFGLPSDFPGGRLPDNPGIADQQLQRHLLQLGSLDTLLGELLDRFDALDLNERCAWVVLADHGINFEPGEYVRQVYKRNAGEIAWVPFFVKAAGQSEGRIDARPVETLDALPTLLDLLGLESPWPLDGRSALAPEQERSAARAVARRFHEPLELGDAPADSVRGLARKSALVAGADDWSGVWAAHLPLELVGRATSELAAGEAVGLGLQLDAPARSDGGRAPIVVAGRIELGPGGVPPEAVWISVEGRLRCAALARELGRGRLRFSALLDEEFAPAGGAGIEVWVPRRDGRLLRVAPL